MVRILADYEAEWEHLSKPHEDVEKRIETILNQYSQAPNSEFKWSYAVIGTFGAGKTQLLYHIFKKSVERGLLPLYFVAEDLFREIISKDTGQTWFPGTLNALVAEKVERARDSLTRSDVQALKEVLNPRNENTTKMMEELINQFSGDQCLPRTVVLLDELEQQYGTLQDNVEAKDRSPLREWFEGKGHLKFVALAPAGIYEMGGADQTRVDRIVIPPADVSYIREKYLPQNPGKANACWWLSRGKPRHLFKAYEKLKQLDTDSLEAPAIHLLVRDELDSIGQEPSRVPPAVLEGIPANRCRLLLNLAPIEGETRRRFVIDAHNLDTGLFAEKLREAFEAFKLKREDAALIGGYFKMVTKALSDESGFSYVDLDDLPELLGLTLDLFLEYEHASPQVKGRLRELMSLYEGLRQPNLFVSLPPLWDSRESSKQLPFSVRQIREAFPFPVMNPMVKNYVPKDIESKLEGQGLPIWKWEEGSIAVLFFASWRDFETYSRKDEFYSLVLPDSKGLLCILPVEQVEGERTILHKWLEQNGKLKIAPAPPLLADFLFSAAGEIQSTIPGELTEILTRFQEDKTDVILSRKSRIYSEAIHDLVRTNLLIPASFCRQLPPYADSVWGNSQIGNPAIAVPGCALAFGNMNPTERVSLARLQELFKSGKEGRGAGPLHPFIVRPRAGHTSVVDDLVPRYDTRGEVRNSPAVARLKEYFGVAEKELSELARLLTLQDFLKLSDEENRRRLVEAFWRAVRGEFDEEGLDSLTERMEREVVPIVREASQLEAEVINHLALEGIDFDDAEDIVRAKDGLEKLLGNAKDVAQDRGSGAPLVRNLYRLLMSQLLDNIDKDLRNLSSSLGSSKTAVSSIKGVSEDLKKNFWEHGKAAQFAEIKEEDINSLVSQETRIEGRLSLGELEEEIRARITSLEGVSESLASLERTLTKLETAIRGPKEE